MPLENIIREYLETPNTSYAILLNGKWGSGKTYYWKRYIQPNIVQYTRPSIKRKDKEYEFYRSVYISLYSIRSIEEINNIIGLSALNMSPENILVKKGLPI